MRNSKKPTFETLKSGSKNQKKQNPLFLKADFFMFSIEKNDYSFNHSTLKRP